MRLLFIAVLTICTAHAQIYTVQTIAGGGLAENTPCSAADLGGLVLGLATDTAGNLFIPVSQYNIVVRCDGATGMPTRVAGTGVAGFSGDDLPAADAEISPVAIAVDPSGNNVYISDVAGYRIRKSANGIITTIAGVGQGVGGAMDENVPAISTQIGSPYSIAVDSVGNLSGRRAERSSEDLERSHPHRHQCDQSQRSCGGCLGPPLR